MDTDGHASKDGQVEFCNTKSELAYGVYELAVSLGLKPTIKKSKAKLNGKVVGDKWRVVWTSVLCVFRLERKSSRLKDSIRGVQNQRYLLNIKKIKSVPVKCIQVENKSHLFLCSKAMIPTHNSFALRACAIYYAANIPGLQIYLFRRKHKDLIKNHMEGPTGFRSLLAPWSGAGLTKVLSEEVRFWNGSKIFLCHCQHDKDKENYQGAEIHILMIDEATHFTESIYTYLRSRNRVVGISIPHEFKKHFPGKSAGRAILSANPGGLGHGWVKRFFISSRPPLTIEKMPKSQGGMRRQFIPALLEDNPALQEQDPDYRYKLRGMHSKALAEAMEYGNWDIVAGSYFEEDFSPKHILDPFKIPKHWPKILGFDWGSAVPFSAGWYAVSSGLNDSRGIITTKNGLGEITDIPSGALIRYREWYGASGPDKGIKMTNKEIARGISQRELANEQIAYRVGGRDMWITKGGPSISEDMGSQGIHFQKADNQRIPGWQQVRARLRGINQIPYLYFFSNNENAIRTIPEAQHDESNPEDVAQGEDHCIEEIRYICQSRPFQKDPERPVEDYAANATTFNDVVQSHFRVMKRKRGRRLYG